MAKKILIADDDPIILKLLQVNLEMEGYDVTMAEDGQEAFELAQKAKPDLIMLDIMMPRMDGLSARRAMLEVPGLREVPVIFLSARAQQADVQKGYDLEVAEYVTKPFDPSDLLQIIERVLSGTYKRPEKAPEDS